MRIFIHSCHAALEYDQALMLTNLGHEVQGDFDVGNTERPKIPKVTDESLRAHRYEGGNFDAVILHQLPQFYDVADRYCRKFSGPVIQMAFGQGSMQDHEKMVEVLRRVNNSYLVAYSRKDYEFYIHLGAPREKTRLIRFGKHLPDFRANGGWSGYLPLVYVTCNDLPSRGTGCGNHIFQELLKRGLPILLSGRGTDESDACYGIGRVPYSTLRCLYRQCRAYLALGTVPAPYTLSLIEAMCSGCPVVAFDNGCGVAEEGLGVLVSASVDALEGLLRKVLSDQTFAVEQSRKMYEMSEELFDMEKVGKQWDNFLREIVRRS